MSSAFRCCQDRGMTVLKNGWYDWISNDMLKVKKKPSTTVKKLRFYKVNIFETLMTWNQVGVTLRGRWHTMTGTGQACVCQPGGRNVRLENNPKHTFDVNQDDVMSNLFCRICWRNWTHREIQDNRVLFTFFIDHVSTHHELWRSNNCVNRIDYCSRGNFLPFIRQLFLNCLLSV